MKKYTFIIPTYQSKDMLKNSLEAINFMDYPKESFDVIVVDDGSTDGTKDYIKGINRNYELKYIYLERCEDSCRSRARNVGISNAEGEFLIFIDADIIVRKDYLREVERYCGSDAELILVGPRIMLPHDISYEMVRSGQIFDEFTFDCSRSELHEFRCGVFNELSYNASAILYPFLYGQSCNLVAPKKWLEKVNGFDEDLKAWGLEDIEAVYKLWKEGLKFFINSKLEVLHQFHWFEGNVVEDDKIAGVEENTRLFLLKHSNIFNIPEEQVYELFKGLAIRFWYIEKQVPEYANRIVIEFKDKNTLEEIKETIVTLSDRKGLEIIVDDYIEDTDLDVWIQLLGKRNSTPKYYPVSRKLPVNQLKAV